MGRLADIERRAEGVDKLESAIFVPLHEVVLGVAIALGILALLLATLLGLALGNSD